ncbi:MAG TPA: 5-formyltetrahydrofolate cyclo-ligase [Nevskiaceae bacterium]|nr:5-formyltetrahydrofolate cyclo-ligase [Nevskiaceae bacterium]
MTESPPDKSTLRRLARARRLAVPAAERRRAAQAAARAALRLIGRRPCCVALYLESGSELSTAPLRRALWAAGHRVVVPAILPGHRLRFHALTAASRLRRGAMDIREPCQRRPVPLSAIEVLILPLLAVDAAGTRLGAGGGYYDRLLARCRGRRRPLRVGYAYAVQQLPTIPREPWDVPLQALVTERGILRFS